MTKTFLLCLIREQMMQWVYIKVKVRHVYSIFNINEECSICLYLLL